MRSSRSSARATPARVDLEVAASGASRGACARASRRRSATPRATRRSAASTPSSTQTSTCCSVVRQARHSSTRVSVDFLFDDAAAQRAGDRSIHDSSSLQMRARLEVGERLGQRLVGGPRRRRCRPSAARSRARRTGRPAFLPGNAAALQAELAAGRRALGDRQLHRRLRASARRRSRRAPLPRARAAGRRRRRAPSTR